MLSMVFACGKEENCFSSAGAWTTDTFALDAFEKIILQDDVQLQLVDGDTFRAHVAFFENLQDGLLLQVSDGVLQVDNANSCRWLKKQDRPKVTITMPLHQLAHFEHKGTENVAIVDTLRNPEMFFETDGNAGSVAFTYVGSNLRMVQHAGASKITVSGRAQNVSIYNGGHGVTDFSDLEANFMDVSNLTGASVQVQALGILQIRNYGRGTVSYCPEPQEKTISNFSGGLIEVCQNNTP